MAKPALPAFQASKDTKGCMSSRSGATSKLNLVRCSTKHDI